MSLKVFHTGDLASGLAVDFPDPSLLQGKDGKWYGFATEHDGISVQVARADDPLGKWTLLEGVDAMAEHTWSSGTNTWAPDVRELDDGSYILYYSGEVPESHRHCIGVARSKTIMGPYTPDPDPWVCPVKEGGAIDASGFKDESTGRRYVVYKVDGNSKGEYIECGSVDDPAIRTPIMLQRVESDGATKIGSPIQILDRIPSQDGALIEAPNLTRRASDGTYILWYSSHCFFDPLYDVKYAYSRGSIEGPYERAPDALLRKPDFGLTAPGGMTSARLSGGEEFIVFHGDCGEVGRCLYSVQYGEE